jgi:DNA repair protein RadD
MLRPYQRAALDEVWRLLEAGKRAPLVVMPTGTGKTRLCVEALRLFSTVNGPGLWVAPRKELLHQASSTLRAAGLEPELDVFVRSNQELSLPGAKVPDVRFVVWDEAHHGAAESWSTLRTLLPRATFLGATATPERGDGKGLHQVFDSLVVGITVSDAIAQGHLVPADILRPKQALAPGELAQCPIAAYLEYAPGTKAILFAPTVEMAIAYACRLRDEHNVPSAAVWGEMPKLARERAVENFEVGKLRVLTSVNALTEGFDVPDVATVILARGFGTAGGYLQAVGRGLRPAPGKTRCLVLDLRGCSHEHGEPADERTFHLEGKAIRRKGEGEDVRFCPVCGSPTVSTACEQCGHSGEMRRRAPRVLGLPIDRFARKRAEGEEEQVATLARWLREARAKKRKPGHAMYRFKAVYGDWPSASVKEAAMRMGRS